MIDPFLCVGVSFFPMYYEGCFLFKRIFIYGTWVYLFYMRVIINESRFDSIFSNWLENEDIQLVYNGYPSRLNGYDELIVSGGIHLYQYGKPIIPYDYIFSYKVGEDKQLIFQELSPPIRNGLFKIFPSEYVMDFFVDKVRDFLQKRIDKKSLPT